MVDQALYENIYFIVNETRQKCNEDTKIVATHLCSDHMRALALLHHRYLEVRLQVDTGAGEFSADFDDENGIYSIVDKDGDCYEGQITEGKRLDESVTPEIEIAFKRGE